MSGMRRRPVIPPMSPITQQGGGAVPPMQQVATGLWGNVREVPATAHTATDGVALIDLRMVNGQARPLTLTLFHIQDEQTPHRGGAFHVAYGTEGAGPSFTIDGRVGGVFSLSASYLRVTAFQGDYEIVTPVPLKLGAYASLGTWGTQPLTLTKTEIDPIPPAGGAKPFNIPPMAARVKVYRSPMEPIRVLATDDRYPVGFRDIILADVPANADCPEIVLPGSATRELTVVNTGGVDLERTDVVFILGL